MSIATTNFPLCKSHKIRERAKVEAAFEVWRCRKCIFVWVYRSDLTKPEAAPSDRDYDCNQGLRNTFEQMNPLYVKGLQDRIARTLGDRSLQNCSFLYAINGFNPASIKELYRRCSLTPTGLSTSYMGTSLVPYAPNFMVKVLGLAGSLLGKGSMPVAEAKPITSTQSSKHE